MQLLDRTLSQGTKVRRYNWHSAGSLGWPYIFQTKYTEAILSNSTRRPLWFEITETLIAVQEKKTCCVVYCDFRHFRVHTMGLHRHGCLRRSASNRRVWTSKISSRDNCRIGWQRSLITAFRTAPLGIHVLHHNYPVQAADRRTDL